MSEVPIMVMPWHRPNPCKPPKMQVDAAFKSSYLDYLGALNLDSPPLPVCLTGIMCTIGAASNKVDTMAELMKSGMTIALVPLSLGQRQDHIDTIANIRTANTVYNHTKNIVYPLAIAVQTKGPGLRIGGLTKNVPVELTLHSKITLTTEKSWRLRCTQYFLYVNFPEICHVLTEGDILLVGNGVVILQVEYVVDKTEVMCKVMAGGELHSFMSLCVPDVPLHLPPLTEEDTDDLRLVASLGVDIVVATHTQTVDHLREVRRVLNGEDNGSGIKIWAHIETKKALNNMDSIIKEADAILLSRVSLTQDMPPEKLFLAQKKVVSACNKAGIPVYLSSHYLPSMQVDITPSIADLFDVANAILDGADGFLLRNTTAIGQHPENTVKTLSRLCREAEAAVWQHQTFAFLSSHMPPPIDPTHAVAISAVEASLKSSASAILLATTSGRSAQLVAHFRPRCPIIAITRYGQVARQLNTWRAVIPLHYVDPPLSDWTREVDVRMQFGLEHAKQLGIVVPGDAVILMNGWRQGAGFTNTLRLVYASESFPWVYPHRLSGDKAVIAQSDSRSTIGATYTRYQRSAQGDRRASQKQSSLKQSNVIKSTVEKTQSRDQQKQNVIIDVISKPNISSHVDKPTESGDKIKTPTESHRTVEKVESPVSPVQNQSTPEPQATNRKDEVRPPIGKEASIDINKNQEVIEIVQD